MTTNVIYPEVRKKIENILNELNELLDVYEENEVELSSGFASQFQNCDNLEDFVYQLTSSLQDETKLN